LPLPTTGLTDKAASNYAHPSDNRVHNNIRWNFFGCIKRWIYLEYFYSSKAYGKLRPIINLRKLIKCLCIVWTYQARTSKDSFGPYSEMIFIRLIIWCIFFFSSNSFWLSKIFKVYME
jgi:hypothetical protein